MITKPVSFNYSEIELIEKKKSSSNFGVKTWEDEDLSSLRTKIKRHYSDSDVQGTICPYCKCEFHSENGRLWDVEHIIARDNVYEFTFEPLNLCNACPACNSSKSNTRVTTSQAKKNYPKKSESYFIVHPHFDRYEDYIYCVKPGEFYFPVPQPIHVHKNIHDKGRKTIEICGLNRFSQKAGYNKDFDPYSQVMSQISLARESSNEGEKKDLLDKSISYLLNFRLQLEKERLQNQPSSSIKYLVDELNSIRNVLNPSELELAFIIELFIDELIGQCNLSKIENFKEKVEQKIIYLSTHYAELKRYLVVFEGIDELITFLYRKQS